LDTKDADLRVKNFNNGIVFPTPIGIASGVLVEGIGMDNMFTASGVDSSSGLSTFIEVGTCTPE